MNTPCPLFDLYLPLLATLTRNELLREFVRGEVQSATAARLACAIELPVSAGLALKRGSIVLSIAAVVGSVTSVVAGVVAVVVAVVVAGAIVGVTPNPTLALDELERELVGREY